MRRLLAFIGILALANCTSPGGNPDKLEITTGSPLALAVGDTTSLFVVSKTAVDATGRSVTTNPYPSFYLTSPDTSIAAIVDKQFVVGKKPGQVSITAQDEKSSLVSDNTVIVNVTAKP